MDLAALVRRSRDHALTVAVAAVDLVVFSEAFFEDPNRDYHTSDELVLAGASGGLAVLTLRLARPRLTLALAVAHAIGFSLATTYRPTLLVCLALGTVAARCTARTAAIAVGAGLLCVPAWVAQEMWTTSGVTTASTVALVACGYVVILAASTAVGLRKRAVLGQVSEAERRWDALARIVVETERRRLARELHDIVAHTVTLMVIQTAGARRLMTADPTRAEEKLASVESSGVEAMGELRRLLSTLRDSDDIDAAGSIGAASTVDDLGDLAAGIEAAGVRVSVRKIGDEVTLDPSVSRTAYRVLQEALTNVAKHAGRTATARVELRGDNGKLHVDIEDDGRDSADEPEAHPQLPGGFGLAGLAERVSLVGGELTAGPTASGGFRVAAILPASQMAPDPNAPEILVSRQRRAAPGADPVAE